MVNLVVEENAPITLSADTDRQVNLSAESAISVTTNDYDRLIHKPQVEGVELVGNKTLNNLGAYTQAQINTLLADKADVSDIPSLDGYATEQWVEDKHYLTEHQSLAEYYTKNQTDNLLDDKADASDIPTKTSDLQNDSGFLTNAVTSFNGQSGAVTYNAPVTSVNNKTGAVMLTASDVSALPSSTIIPTITDTYSGTSSDGMSGKAVKSAIDALDGTVSGSASNGKTLTAFTQTNGKVSATFGDISITKSQVSDFPTLSNVATSGSYNDLSDTPTIPTVNNATLTIQKNGSTVNTFTANASSDVTANITVPTKTSDITNDSGFITDAGVTSFNGSTGAVTYTPPVTSVNGDMGVVVLDADDVGALPTTEKSVLFYGQVDNTSTATAFTAQIDGITEYFDGLTVMLKNGVVTSASGFTININGLGAKHAYSNMALATAETTLFNINYTMMFTYDSTRVEGGGWVLYRGYNSNDNTIGYQVRTNSMSLPMKSITYRYRLLFESADGEHFVPANNSTSTNATSSRTVCQDAINPFGTIRYYGTTASVAAGSRPSATALWEQYAIALGYSFNRTGSALTLTSWKPVYVKCAPQSDGSAIIDSTTPYVQDLPTTADGKIYIYLGVAYSATNIELVPHHPIYWYKDGQIRPYTNVGGVTSWNGQTGDVTYTAPVTSVNGNTGAVTVTEGLAPLIGTTSTVTPQQVMTALGEGRDICITADSTFDQVNITLKFTNFNRVTDSDYGGVALDLALSQTIASVDGVNFGVWTLVGGTYNNTSIPWTVLDADIATKAYAVPMTRTINGHALSSNLSLDPSDIGAIGLPNGANMGDFLVYSGTAWIPQSLSTWQGGNY